MEVDLSGWSGDGGFTGLLVGALKAVTAIRYLRVQDAAANPGQGAFSFISNELFVAFDTIERQLPTRRLGFIPGSTRARERTMTLEGLQATLTALEAIGPPDYADEGMLQYLRTERIIPPYQTRGYKLVELVRIYEVSGPGPPGRSTSGTEKLPGPGEQP